MSFLAPLYALGALAIAAPIILHLIRRSPRGEVPFSSLMFLAPTPPRLTRRSRLDQLLLLFLRGLALALLALAFTRPFLRQAASLNLDDSERRRVVVLVDQSASMRRGTVWERAVALADGVIASARPGDQLAVIGFDDATRPVFGFSEGTTLDDARRLAVARSRLRGLKPGWGGTNLGQALVDALAALEDTPDKTEKAGRMPRRVVLVTDLQQGSRLEALGGYDWPRDVGLELKTVSDPGANAGLQRLPESDAEADEGEAESKGSNNEPAVRVRVDNDAASRREAFTLTWTAEGAAPAARPVEVYVPAGESRVVRVPRSTGPAPARSLRLAGDVHNFDNTVYFADEPKTESNVLFVGDDRDDDAAGLLYYLRRVFSGTARAKVNVTAAPAGAAVDWPAENPPTLVVLASPAGGRAPARLAEYVQSGGTLLAVLRAPGLAPGVAGVLGVEPFEAEEGSVGRDLLLGEIAFDHPLFVPLAGPQFNDFTKIHFWKYWRVDPAALGGARVLARFENGDPALLEKAVGKGRVLVLTSGWNPADSQLARSSKFLPLMTGMLAGDPYRGSTADYRVNQPVPLPGDGAAGAVVKKPDGTSVTVEAGQTRFTDTDQPGVYTVETPRGPRSFAVNLDPAESRTSPLESDTLEQFGCRLASAERDVAEREHRRQLQNAELEGRQKLWRWVIVAAVVVLILETWLAGRSTRPRPAPSEGLAA
jgi:hypothetical protein